MNICSVYCFDYSDDLNNLLGRIHPGKFYLLHIHNEVSIEFLYMFQLFIYTFCLGSSFKFISIMISEF